LSDGQSRLWAEIARPNQREIGGHPETIEWELGTYRLAAVVVLRPQEPPGAASGAKRFEVLCMSASPEGSVNAQYAILDEPPVEYNADAARTDGARKTIVRGPARNRWAMGSIDPGRNLPWESWSNRLEPFEVEAGRINEYSITLPDELIKLVRERLSALPAASVPSGPQ
jgi:hypothetical protein